MINGNIVPSNQPCIQHNDRSFALGHGLFETILINKNAIPALHYHWQRLASSAKLVGIDLPFSRHQLAVMILRLIDDNCLQDKVAGARLTLTRGESERGILPSIHAKPNAVLSVFECSQLLPEKYSACIVQIKKNEYAISSRIKSTSYLDNILAKQEAFDQGYDEAILLNTKNTVADGAITNVFIVQDGKIITPPISDGALPGVVKNVLLEEFSSDFSIIEQSVTEAMLQDADEIFVTNALMGVRPVTRFNTRAFQKTPISSYLKQVLIERKNYI